MPRYLIGWLLGAALGGAAGTLLEDGQIQSPALGSVHEIGHVAVHPSTPASTLAPNRALDELRLDLKDGRVKAVQVYFLPYDISSPTPITSAKLRRGPGESRKLKLDGAFRERLALALELTEVEPLAEQPDVRWGLIFLDADGNERHSLFLDGRYFDGTGRRGVLNEVSVRTNGSIGYLLEQTFPEFLALDPDEVLRRRHLESLDRSTQ
jgi:hypothetical protein